MVYPNRIGDLIGSYQQQYLLSFCFCFCFFFGILKLLFFFFHHHSEVSKVIGNCIKKKKVIGNILPTKKCAKIDRLFCSARLKSCYYHRLATMNESFKRFLDLAGGSSHEHGCGIYGPFKGSKAVENFYSYFIY